MITFESWLNRLGNMKLSKKQIFRLVLAALFFVLLLLIIFCHYGYLWVKLLAIVGNVLLMASMLISFFDVKRRINNIFIRPVLRPMVIPAKP